VSLGSGITFLLLYTLFQKIPTLLKEHSGSSDLDEVMIQYLIEQQKQV